MIAGASFVGQARNCSALRTNNWREPHGAAGESLAMRKPHYVVALLSDRAELQRLEQVLQRELDQPRGTHGLIDLANRGTRSNVGSAGWVCE